MKGSYDYLVGGADEWKGFQERNGGLRQLGRSVRAKAAARAEAGGVESGETCEVVDVYSDGTRMSATLWKPSGALRRERATSTAKGSLPAVLMCHGWGGIRDGLDARARVFARAGFVVLTFDYRGWGASDGVLASLSDVAGEVVRANAAQQDEGRRSDGSHGRGARVTHVTAHVCRQTVDMAWQQTDIEAALDFLDGEPLVDPARVALWGISQGGGHVLSIAARRRGNVRAVVAMVPSCGEVGAGDPTALASLARRQAIARARGHTPLSVPTGVSSGHLSGMDGVPNLQVLRHYRPLETCHLIACPVLVVDALEEECFDRRKNGFAAYRTVVRRNAQSKYALMPGRHYDAYDGAGGQLRLGNALAIAFLREHLGLGDEVSGEVGGASHRSPPPSNL